MCADILLVCFMITKLLVDTASATPTIREEEINLKLRLMVPKSSSVIAYPNDPPSVSLNNPFINPFLTLQRPHQPPQLNIQLGPSVDHSYYGAPAAAALAVPRRGSIVRSRVRPSLVIHQPIFNYHYSPTAYAPPTRLVPLQVPVSPTPPVIKPVVVVSGFNTNYSVNYDFRSRRPAPVTTSTPKPLVDLKELLKELTVDVEDVAAKPNCPCNDTTKDVDRLKEPLPKDDEKELFIVGRLNQGEYDDDEDDSDDIDDEAKGRVTAVRPMWGGYLPRKLLENALRKSNVVPMRRGRKKMDDALLKHFQKGMKALQKTIKNQKETENAEQEMDEDLPDDPEGEESHSTYIIDRGNKVTKYHNDFSDKEQVAEESNTKYNKNPQGWNPKNTKGYWSPQVLSGQSSRTEGSGSGDEAEKAGGLAAIIDNDAVIDGYYKPDGGDLSHNFKASLADVDNPDRKHDADEQVVDLLNREKNDSASEQSHKSLSYGDKNAASLGVNTGKMITC